MFNIFRYMLKYSKLTPASRKFLAWKWCLAEESSYKNKERNQDKCDKLYEEYVKIVTKKNKEQ